MSLKLWTDRHVTWSLPWASFGPRNCGYSFCHGHVSGYLVHIGNQQEQNCLLKFGHGEGYKAWYWTDGNIFSGRTFLKDCVYCSSRGWHAWSVYPWIRQQWGHLVQSKNHFLCRRRDYAWHLHWCKQGGMVRVSFHQQTIIYLRGSDVRLSLISIYW